MSAETQAEPTSQTEATQTSATAVAAPEPVATVAEPKQQTTTDADKPKAQDAPKSEPVYEFKTDKGWNLDKTVMDTYAATAKELGVTPEVAQKMLTKLAPVMQERASARAQEAQAQALAEWEKASRNDKEFGGDRFDQSISVANKALAKFAPEILPLLRDSGLGNHPDMIRAWLRVGNAISQDKLVVTTGDPLAASKDDPETRLKRMYPTMS